MKKLAYITLADLRNADPVKFDQQFAQCFYAAANSLSKETLIAAFTPSWKEHVLKKAA